MSVGQNSSLGWNELCRKGDRLRVQGVGAPPPDDTEHAALLEQLHPDSPRGHVARSPIRTPSGRSTRHSRSSHPDDSISYPDRGSGSLSHTPCIPDLLMVKEFKASVLHVSELSIALPWIPNNSPQSWIALVIKLLTKNTKTYTI